MKTLNHTTSFTKQQQPPTLRQYLNKYLAIRSPKSSNHLLSIAAPLQINYDKALERKINNIKRIVTKYVTDQKICELIDKQLEDLREIIKSNKNFMMSKMSKDVSQTTCFTKKSTNSRINNNTGIQSGADLTIRIDTEPQSINQNKDGIRRYKTMGREENEFQKQISFEGWQKPKIYKAYSKQYVTNILPVIKVEIPESNCFINEYPEQKYQKNSVENEAEWLPPKLDKKYSDDEESIRVSKRSATSKNSFAESKIFMHNFMHK